jgi:hypothetical protein
MNKKVNGSANGRPNFAPMKPDAHRTTNIMGAAKIATSSRMRRMDLGMAIPPVQVGASSGIGVLTIQLHDLR